MSYELVHNTSRRAPKLTSPAISKAYRKMPNKDERMSDSAIGRLEELLSERGVDYGWDSDSVYWTDSDCVPWTAELRRDGDLDLYCLGCLPEQAVAASLGNDGVVTEYKRSNDGVAERGTCHDKCSRFNAWVCSECGATVLLMFDDFDEPSYSVDGIADVPHYCPNCGRKVVDE